MSIRAISETSSSLLRFMASLKVNNFHVTGLAQKTLATEFPGVGIEHDDQFLNVHTSRIMDIWEIPVFPLCSSGIANSFVS